METPSDLKPILRCPRDLAELAWNPHGARCAELSCGLSQQIFPMVDGRPVLVDFADSVLDRSHFEQTAGASPIRRAGRLSLLIRFIESSTNKIAERFSRDMVGRLRPGSRLLVVGGGTIGSGAEALYQAGGVRVVGTDIYRSAHTDVIADGHHLPFADASFDAVWIQAVLEHVLDPQQVVREIHRVLKRGGLVFADTPFMQQVHEGAYDFTRFSVSGHRWLFRRFDCIEAGATAGVGTTLIWSIKYLVRALTGSGKAARVATWPFIWLRFLDGKGRRQQDGASGVYFYGTAAETEIGARDIVRFYSRDA